MCLHAIQLAFVGAGHSPFPKGKYLMSPPQGVLTHPIHQHVNMQFQASEQAFLFDPRLLIGKSQPMYEGLATWPMLRLEPYFDETVLTRSTLACLNRL